MAGVRAWEQLYSIGDCEEANITTKQRYGRRGRSEGHGDGKERTASDGFYGTRLDSEFHHMY